MPNYALFPVNDAAPCTVFRVKSRGEIVSDFTASYDPANPRFFACIDLTRFEDPVIVDGEGNVIPTETTDRLPSLDEIPGGRVCRPAVHFTATLGWTNDPNGLIYAGGIWHMFFQHNPTSTRWGNMTWGHAVSRDLLRWTDLGDTLFPDETGTMFSGSAVCDEYNVSGLGEGAILLFYTAAGDQSELSRGVPFTQCLAYSTDGGMTFTKYAGNPVIPHIAGSNRDPKVQWCEELGKYTLSLYLDGNDYTIFSSDDLLHWTRFCDITMPADNECPDFYPLTADDGQRKWVFSGAHDTYVVGGIREGTFVPEQEALPYHIGPGMSYAAQTFSGTEERRIKIAWDNVDAPGAVFHSQMGFPVEMFLKKVNGTYRLGSLPVKEIEGIRRPAAVFHFKQKRGTMKILGAFPNAAEVCLTVGADSGPFTLACYGMEIAVDPGANEIRFGAVTAPLTLTGRRNLRVLFDTLGAEIFADGGLVYATLGRTADKGAGIRIDAENADIKVEAYKLAL